MDGFLDVFCFADGAGQVAGFDVGGQLGNVQRFFDLVFLLVGEVCRIDSLVRDVTRD